MNYKQRFAIEKKHRGVLVNKFNLEDKSGIYFIERVDENEIKYIYVGQAKKVLTRMVQHMMGYSKIDLSLKKRGLYSPENLGGWWISASYYPEDVLDQKEQEYINFYGKTHQLYNVTGGGQKNKSNLVEGKTPKGYHDGVAYGKKKAINELRTFFEKYLDYSIKGKTNKIKERKFAEFEKFLKGDKEC